MTFRTTRFVKAVISGLFYLLVSHIGTMAHATEPSMGSLWSEARAAYDGFDVDLFEAKVADLREALRRTGRFQEEVWALREFGFDRMAADLERDITLKLRTEEVLENVAIDGLGSQVRRLTFASGLVGVFHPRVVGDPDRDVFVYRVARIIGFNLVPITVHRMLDRQEGSVQLFIAGAEPGDTDFRIKPYTNIELHILDYITIQSDRRPPNWLRTSGGGVAAIDNELALAHFYENRGVGRLYPSDQPPAYLPKAYRKGIERLRDALADNSDFAFNFLPLYVRTTILKRIDVLLDLPSSCEDTLAAPK